MPSFSATTGGTSPSGTAPAGAGGSVGEVVERRARIATPLPLACGAVLRLGSAARAGQPPLLLVSDPWLLATADDMLARALCEAGQVVRG